MRPSSELIATRNLICSAPRRCVRHRRPRVRPVGAPTLGGPCFRKRCDTLRKSQPNITYSSGRMWIVSVQANIKQQEETYPCLIQTGVSSSLCLIGSLTAQYIYTIPVDYIHGPHTSTHPNPPTSPQALAFAFALGAIRCTHKRVGVLSWTVRSCSS